MKSHLIDLLQNPIFLLKFSFLSSLSLNFSAICPHIPSKFNDTSAQKILIFSMRADSARSLIKFLRINLWILFSPLFIWSDIPFWVEAQIEKDFEYFIEKTISLSDLEAFYKKKGNQLQLVKFTIENNTVKIDSSYVDQKKMKERILNYLTALNTLCKNPGLPNTILLISVNDGLNAKEEFPIFAMCKKDSDRIILLPDYEALGSRYQVLKTVDITKVEFPWETKRAQLIWRGSTAQLFVKIREEHLPKLSRVKLCELSELYPEVIDAKFTIFTQGGETIPYLRRFEGERLSFEEQMHYKYHILIDGNTSAYSKSGWKFFTNSLVFKPESKWVQWYYQDLQPYVHYIPVDSDLSNLVEKIHWALENEDQAMEIAKKGREFALSHLTISDHLLYLYQAILRYQTLQFVP